MESAVICSSLAPSYHKAEEAECIFRAGCSLAGILAVMHSALDLKATLGGKHPHLFYLLASALRPRMLMTLDTEGKLLPVPVRVGQAVDTVAQVTPPDASATAVAAFLAYGLACCESFIRLAMQPWLCADFLVSVPYAGWTAQDHHGLPDPHNAGAAERW